MEPVQRAHKTSNYASKDYISSMPDNVITNILNRLPIKDAVSTDILARNWRCKWTLLTHLIFDLNFYNDLPNNFNVKHITRLLRHLKGPIRKFVIFISPAMLYRLQGLNYDEIQHWVLFLSRKGIEDLTIRNCYGEPLKLPTQLYSRMELKHLKLHYCCFPNSHSFRSFPNLLSLDLCYVTFQSCTLWEFIARCPLLEFLKINLVTTNEMKLIEIAKLRNIKKLYLSFGVLNKTTTITSSNIFQLTSLPKLEKLTLNFVECKLLAEANAEKKVPAAFLCLKTLKLYGVDFMNDVMVSFIIEMICGSPNLQLLVTRASNMLGVLPSEFCSFDLDSNTMGPLQLQSVVLHSFLNSENELSLIKFILACSPLLKKISITLTDQSDDEQSDDETKRIKIKCEFARKLLKLHRASPTAEIDFLEWL